MPRLLGLLGGVVAVAGQAAVPLHDPSCLFTDWLTITGLHTSVGNCVHSTLGFLWAWYCEGEEVLGLP